MRVVAALGGNALLRRGERPDATAQQANIARAVASLAPIAAAHDLVITHGNGPQVGLLELESESDQRLSRPYPLDVLTAQTQGMIGYWLVRELAAAVPARPALAVLTQTVVDPDDPAFARPTKFIGPGYDDATASSLAAAHGWRLGRDGEQLRRVVASPPPLEIVELDLLRDLVERGVLLVCCGGGGAAVRRDSTGRLSGVEAVVDKDAVSALLASRLGADALLLLTDAPAVELDYGTDHARRLARATPAELRALDLPAGSMGPKAEAAAAFTAARPGALAAIGALADAPALLAGTAGTTVRA